MASTVQHGCSNRESQFEIVQHKYAAAGAVVYIECLEVLDAPENKLRYNIHWHYVPNADFPGDHSWYFESLETAIAAWKDFYFKRNDTPADRFIDCEGYTQYEYTPVESSPWYYSSLEL
jgi:hypothetical protein